MTLNLKFKSKIVEDPTDLTKHLVLRTVMFRFRIEEWHTEYTTRWVEIPSFVVHGRMSSIDDIDDAENMRALKNSCLRKLGMIIGEHMKVELIRLGLNFNVSMTFTEENT